MRVVVILGILVLAGCAAPAEVADPLATTPPASAGFPPLGLSATGCWEGGGHSVHPVSFNPLPDPWKPADVLADVGPQLIYSEVPDPTKPVPEEGSTMGNYHATVVCEGWTLDGEPLDGVVFGFVGMKVEAPPFDPEPEIPTHHYLVTVVATSHAAVLDRLAEAGFAPMEATHTRTNMPGGNVRIQMATDRNGEYDSIFRPKPFGDMQAKHVRLWFQASEEGHEHGETERRDRASGEFRPIALDLVATSGTHAIAEGQGYFSHTGTDHHFPFPGARGQTAALLYEGFDREFRWGPRPAVVLAEAYLH